MLDSFKDKSGETGNTSALGSVWKPVWLNNWGCPSNLCSGGRKNRVDLEHERNNHSKVVVWQL